MPGEAGADPDELRNYYDAVEPLTGDLEGKVSDLRSATAALSDYEGQFTLARGNNWHVDLASGSHITMVERLITEIKETDQIALDVADSFYTIESGDNLWTIAEQAIKDAHPDDPDYQPSEQEIYEYWEELKAANKDNLRSGNPDLIYPGEQIYLPLVPGATTPPDEEDEDEEDETEEPEDAPDDAVDVAFVHDMSRDDIIAVLTDPTFIQGPPPEVIAEMAVVLMGSGGDVAGAGIAIDALIARQDAAEIFMANPDNVVLLYSWADALEAVRPMGEILAELESLQSGN